MTPDLDEGPCLSFCEFRIKNKENNNLWKNLDNLKNNIEESALFLDIRKKIILHERALLKKTLEKISIKEIDTSSIDPIDLSDEVNGSI